MSSMTHLSKKRLNLFHQIFEYDSTFNGQSFAWVQWLLRVFHYESFFQYDSTFKLKGVPWVEGTALDDCASSRPPPSGPSTTPGSVYSTWSTFLKKNQNKKGLFDKVINSVNVLCNWFNICKYNVNYVDQNFSSFSLF